MGSRRTAYAHTALQYGAQHEQVMPRQFNAEDFHKLMEFQHVLAELHSYIKQLDELAEDTLMAARMDVMIYTTMVHNGFRLANKLDPSYDEVLRELDQFNKQNRKKQEQEELADDEGELL